MNSSRRRFAAVAAASALSLKAHDDENPPPIARTALIHGIAGPFAVAGYLMGEHALPALGVERAAMELEVVHYSPDKVQWSCVIDGLQAATGASLGKMNLRRVESAKVYSVVRNRKTGKSMRFELLPGFLKKFQDLPHGELPEAGRRVAEMKPAEVFSVL